VVRWQNCSSFASLWFEGWLVQACKCAAMCGGVFLTLLPTVDSTVHFTLSDYFNPVDTIFPYKITLISVLPYPVFNEPQEAQKVELSIEKLP
jgi:hypothetical protein